MCKYCERCDGDCGSQRHIRSGAVSSRGQEAWYSCAYRRGDHCFIWQQLGFESSRVGWLATDEASASGRIEGWISESLPAYNKDEAASSERALRNKTCSCNRAYRACRVLRSRTGGDRRAGLSDRRRRGTFWNMSQLEWRRP